MKGRSGVTALLLAKWGEFLRPSFYEVLKTGGVAIREVDSEQELRRLGSDAHALYVRMPNYASREVIEGLPHLRVIAVPGAGLEVVDMEAATNARIPVVSGRGLGADAVVEWTVLSMLWLARDAGTIWAAMRSGDWEVRHSIEGRRDLRSLTIGVVGFGQIGRRVSRAARDAFGSTVLVADSHEPARKLAQQEAFAVVEMDQLLRRSDIVTIHTQVKHEQPAILGQREFQVMAPGSYVVNTGRGQAMDYRALLEALATGHLGGAAIDVYPQEPPASDLVERLAGHPRVLISPHQAGLTEDAAEALSRGVASSVVQVLQGRHPDSCANPQVWR